MQNTKSNEEKAQQDLAHIALTAKAIEKKREELSIIEFGILKDIETANPDFDFHSKMGAITQDESEKKELDRYLNHVMPVTIGYKSPASSMNAAALQERIYASTKYLVEGKKVSDKKVGVIAESRVEMEDIYKALIERGENYANGTYDKTMIDPVATQAAIDEGKNPFKKTESLALYYGLGGKDGQPKAFAVNRSTGNQGEYPSYNFPNNDAAMSIVKGNPFSDKKIIIVSGDLHNLALKPDAEKPHKSSAVTDDIEAATLGHVLNLNGKQGEGVALIVTDVRSLEAIHKRLVEVNPNAQTVIYTDNQTDQLKQTLSDGSIKTTDSAATQAIQIAKLNSRSEALSKKHGLWLKPIKDSLLTVLTKLKERADEKNPDNDYQAKEHYKDSKDRVAELVEKKGLEHTEQLRSSYLGKNKDNTADLNRKAERDSRLNARINPHAKSISNEEFSRPVAETTRETIAPNEPAAPRIPAPMR